MENTETLNLPVYLVDIDDIDPDTGVNFVARTVNPAIERMAMTFNNQKVQRFKDVATDRRIIMGPLMIPNLPIYRRDEDGQEYYVMFSKACIEKIAVKFSERGFWNNMNDEHDPSKVIKGVVLYNNFMTDSSLGIQNPAGWPDSPEGTWYGVYKVVDDKVWEDFKSKGEFGFSVEGMFLHKYVCPKPVDELEALRQEVLTLSKLLDLLNNSELKS